MIMKVYPPPMYTCVRANTLQKSVDEIAQTLQREIDSRLDGRKDSEGVSQLLVYKHDTVTDCLVIPSTFVGVAPDSEASAVIVDYLCGMAVLRGASVYAPGIMSVCKSLSPGDRVSVFADVSGKCLKGMTSYDGERLFVGNGVSLMSRDQLFKSSDIPRQNNVAVNLCEPIVRSPSLNGVLDREIFLQNLPSIVAGHVLQPRPGHDVLDMCAAPGGKSTHLYNLMRANGILVACDRSVSKVKKIEQNFRRIVDNLTNVKILKIDSRTLADPCVRRHHLIPDKYDRILLDAPCSAMGQRPRVIVDANKKHNSSYPNLQRQLFTTAAGLLKPDGVLVYCTCTSSGGENEQVVEWALSTFPHLCLAKQRPHVGKRGRTGVSNLTRDQLDMLQYFDMGQPLPVNGERILFDLALASAIPENETLSSGVSLCANNDTIGFFIAKFVNCEIVLK